jgi:uncharacterized membrane protein
MKRVEITKFQMMIEIITIIVLIGLLIYLPLNWNAIPEKIPSHFDFFGNPNIWSDRASIKSLPIVCLIIYILLTIVSFFPNTWNVPVKVTEENKDYVYKHIRNSIVMIKLELVAVFTYITICSAKAIPLGKLFLMIFLACIFGILGVAIALANRKK